MPPSPVHDLPSVPPKESADVEARRLAAMVESSDDAIVGVTLDGLIESWNGGAERTYGYAASEVVGRALTTLIPPERHDEVAKNLARLRRGERVAPYETVRVRKDGARIHLSLAISPIRDRTGRVVGTSGIGRDITAQKKAERRAAAQLRANRLLIDCRDLDEVARPLLQALAEELDWVVGGLWLVDREASLLRCRDTYERGSSDLSPFAAVSRQMTFARGVGLPGRVWASGEPAWIEDVTTDANFPRAPFAAAAGLHGAVGFPLRTNSGVLGVVECFTPEVRPPDAGLLLLMGSIGSEMGQFVERGWVEAERRELLARERAARASAEASRERLAFLVEASAELAVSLDADAIVATVARLVVPHLAEACVVDLLDDPPSFRNGVVVHVDPERAERARRGRAPPDPLGAHPEAVALRAGRALLVAGPVEAWAGDGSAMAVPLIARGRPLGAMLLVGGDQGRRYGDDDLPLLEELARRAALALDHAALYRDAQAAVRARDRFLARASHELRTPLTSAVGTLRLLKQARAAARRFPDELLDMAARSVDAMAALVNDLLDASTLASGHQPLRREPVDLGDLARSSVAVLATEAKDRGVAVGVEAAAGLVLEADRVKLEQVLLNLLANALKFTPTGGEIVVEAAAEAAGVAIRIRDSGHGIAPEHLEAIFEPFFQVTAPAPRQTGDRHVRRNRGTGLGLAICRQIVALHAGRIWAESEGIGRGSTFVVLLPASGSMGARAEPDS